MKVSVYFCKYDVWIGVYWRRFEAYICLIPMVVIHLRWGEGLKASA